MAVTQADEIERLRAVNTVLRDEITRLRKAMIAVRGSLNAALSHYTEDAMHEAGVKDTGDPA